MEIPKIFESEYRFACIVWEHEPIAMKELIKLCTAQLGWKRTTTYTVLKRLSERGIMQSVDSIVTSLISKEAIQRQESQEFINRTFEGSLPSFIAAFTSNKALSSDEAAEIKKMIEEYEKEGK
ncbi:MAG: BlaI/MecI/CopY family transcriptional regulator [Eubacteriales bacterium]